MQGLSQRLAYDRGERQSDLRAAGAGVRVPPSLLTCRVLADAA